MSPSAFVGSPDWRSAVLAALFALPWLVLLARGRLRQPWLWVALAVAAALFPFSIAWIQVPIQEALNRFWVSVLEVPTIQRYLLLIGLPTIAVTGLVQEGAKLLVAIGALWAASRRTPGEKRKAQAGLAFGAAAGAGYGAFEAFWVFNQVFGLGWSWATVQLGGIQALLPFVERFFAVPLHIGAGVVAGYGYATGQPWRFWLLAAAVHALANYAVLMLQAGVLGVTATEVWLALVAVGVMAVTLWLRWGRRSPVGVGPDSNHPGPATPN